MPLLALDPFSEERTRREKTSKGSETLEELRSDYMMRKVLFSSKSGFWETPKDLYDQLDQEFHFTLDVCATVSNAKSPRYFFGDEGLDQSWEGETCFMNPPYGRAIEKWIAKAHYEIWEKNNHWTRGKSYGKTTVVGLLPARTDTKWFWTHILAPDYEIRLIRGRLKFSDHKNSAPFPSMIVIFR